MGVSGLALVLGVLCLFVTNDLVHGYYDDNACYFCSDTGSNPDCRSYKALKKANEKQDEKEQVLLRNCSAGQYFCMIEMFIKKGEVFSYIRDCTTTANTSFSFGKIGRLVNVRTDNVTTCTFDRTTMGQMCLTICSGKLCNGPISAGHIVHHGYQAVFVIGLLVFREILGKY